ncbi:hypothetical protein OS493_003866 [Desmophyllum pertusum]|uniref:Ig-like domain-containing protein n=1 Tax=Desmophyllum pertusum TaxID=174260 RepID=A0A9X0DBV2_9CNID|nr:hypothetical protein OS493_003866 [Desmophyllum pertusum]
MIVFCVFISFQSIDKLKGAYLKIHIACYHIIKYRRNFPSLESVIMAKANKLFFSLVAVLISLASGEEGSFFTYNTQDGCNATLLCNLPGNVTWIYAATSQKIEGPRFQTSTHGFFSILLILDVSKNDGGNVTCVAKERNMTISLEVCYDKGNTAQCQSTIGGGDDCTESVFFSDCMKSCGLCPEPNCTAKTVLPTMMPTTANPQTTNDGNLVPTTESSSTRSSTTRVVERNNGSSLCTGFYNLYVLASSLFSIKILMFPNI